MPRPRRSLFLLTAAAAATLLLGGCLKRTISITSEPPGALVWVNDVEVGRTPVDFDFTFYGTYDVRLRREGYEPIVTSRKARAPFYEHVGIDLIAEAIPTTIESRLHWHFDLTPTAERVLGRDEAAEILLERARGFRGQATGEFAPPQLPPPAPPAAPTGDAGAPTTVDPGATDRTTTAPAPTTPR